MFAYIFQNKISFLSAEKLEKDFLPDAEKYQIIEYDNKITEPIYNEKTQKIEQKKYKETRDEKFARVYKKLLELPELNATTNTAILEGLEFSPKEIYELTADRVYGGNPYEPTVIVGNMVFNKNDPEFLEDTQKKLMLSNQILAFFGMDKLWPLEREEAKKKAREEIEMMKLTPAKKPNS